MYRSLGNDSFVLGVLGPSQRPERHETREARGGAAVAVQRARTGDGGRGGEWLGRQAWKTISYPTCDDVCVL